MPNTTTTIQIDTQQSSLKQKKCDKCKKVSPKSYRFSKNTTFATRTSQPKLQKLK
jgi:epoxyqueuosine reductase QueG